MELEDMKKAWTDLDARLSKQELFNENMIHDRMADRSQRLVNKLLNLDLLGALVMVVALPFVVWLSSVYYLGSLPFVGVFLKGCLVISIAVMIGQVVKVSILLGVNISGSVKNGIRRIARYDLYMHYEKMVMTILIPLLILMVVISYAKLGATLWAWSFMICLNVVVVLATIYSYKKVYDKNIVAIKRSLGELRDLREE